MFRQTASQKTSRGLRCAHGLSLAFPQILSQKGYTPNREATVWEPGRGNTVA